MTTISPPAAWRLTRERPAIVIAIASLNRVDLLRTCLASVRDHTSYPHYRVCVFDQGSTDGSVEYLRRLAPDVDAIFSPHNIGFTLATNAIIERYPAWDVVLLNNDTRVTAGWLRALVETATRAAAIGMVGARLVSSNGVLQEAGGEVFADGRVRARGRGESAADPRYLERHVVDYCSAACLFVKRTVFERCGALERAYEAGYYEDVDLAFRARAAGFAVIYEPQCVVVHREHSSYGSDVAGTLMRRHLEIFRSRWATMLAAQPSNPFELHGAGGRPRLLLATELVPGNALLPRMRRIRQLMRDLNGTFQLAYLNVAAKGLDRYAGLIDELGATPFVAPLHGAPGAIGLDEEELLRVNYFPIVVCGNADAAAFLRDRFPAALLEATTVAVDVGMDADVVGGARRSGARHFIVMSDAQRRELVAAMPHARCAVLPVRVEATTSRRVPREARADIVMLSDNLDGAAAAAAVGELLHAIVPALRARQPHASVRLGGGPLSPEMLVNGPAGLELIAGATSIGSVLDRARVVAVPQHWCGPDTVSNIAEARARGIPIVTTTAVARDAGLVDGVDAIAVETPEAFVAQIARVYADPWLWESLACGSSASPAVPPNDDVARALATWASREGPATPAAP